MKVIKSRETTWIEIKNPKESDIKELKKLSLHPLVLEAILPPLNNPRIQNFDDYLFLVLFYPHFNKKTSRIIPYELDIVVSKHYIITSHYKDIPPLEGLFKKYQSNKENLKEEPGKILYLIIYELLKTSFPILDNTKKDIDIIENKIYKKRYREVVHQVSLVKRDIIGFQRVIKPQRLVIETLAEQTTNIFGKKLKPYFGALVDLYNHISNILNTHARVLSALDSTNQSLLTTRINEIIKTLTIFSVIVFPLTLFAAIFGMNTSYLPFVGSPFDFWIITGIMLAATVGMLLIFRMKKWI